MRRLTWVVHSETSAWVTQYLKCTHSPLKFCNDLKRGGNIATGRDHKETEVYLTTFAYASTPCVYLYRNRPRRVQKQYRALFLH